MIPVWALRTEAPSICLSVPEVILQGLAWCCLLQITERLRRRQVSSQPHLPLGHNPALLRLCPFEENLAPQLQLAHESK